MRIFSHEQPLQTHNPRRGAVYTLTDMEKFPKRYTKFLLDDYYQTDVDEFHDGRFLFLSAKMIKIEGSELLLDLVNSFDVHGWVISTYSYTNRSYEKILICGYEPKPWKNGYHIRSELSEVNGCCGYAVNSTLDEFFEWVKITN